MVLSYIIQKIYNNLVLKDTLRYEKGLNNIEVAKITSLKFIPEDLVKKKVKLLELIDIPAKVPEDIELEPLEEGVLMRAYKAKIYLKR